MNTEALTQLCGAAMMLVTTGTAHAASLAAILSPPGLYQVGGNQPPWNALLIAPGGQPAIVAESPGGYHPPTVMTYPSYPRERVDDDLVKAMAVSDIRRASEDCGLTEAQSRSSDPVAATYGVMREFETVFIGKVHSQLVDVRI